MRILSKYAAVITAAACLLMLTGCKSSGGESSVKSAESKAAETSAAEEESKSAEISEAEEESAEDTVSAAESAADSAEETLDVSSAAESGENVSQAEGASGDNTEIQLSISEEPNEQDTTTAAPHEDTSGAPIEVDLGDMDELELPLVPVE